MAKRYSQDLRDRVIEAVERGKMSRRAAGRHYAISKDPWPSSGWSALSAKAREGLSDMAAIVLPKLMSHRDFLKGRARREIGHHASGFVRSPVGRARGQSRHLDDEPFLPQDRGDG